jgi:spermidine synthase
LEFDRDEHGGVLVSRDGHPQSYVDLVDPGNLSFEYVVQLACVIDVLAPPGPIRVTHVGGAGLTLPRWVEHTRPGSPQIVLEPDASMTEAVRRELPLPRRHRIRVRAVDGAVGMRSLATGSADVIVMDAYAGGRVPADLVTDGFLGECARVVGPAGLFVANLADDRGFGWVPRVAAGARNAFGHVAWVALTEVLRGRRFGNGVLVAMHSPIGTAELTRALRRLPWPSAVRTDAELASRTGGPRPFTDADAVASPEPPDPGRWRVT